MLSAMSGSMCQKYHRKQKPTQKAKESCFLEAEPKNQTINVVTSSVSARE